MVTKTIPAKPKTSKIEKQIASDEDSLTPEQEAAAKEKEKKVADAAAKKSKAKAAAADKIRKRKEAEKNTAEKAAANAKAKRLKEEAAAKKDWSSAQTQLIAALKSAPSDGIKGIASLRLARVQIQQEEFDQALATLAKPLPESFTAAIEEIKGDTYLLQGKKELARNAYQAAIAADGLASSPNLQMKLDDLATAINLTTIVHAAK